MNDSTQALMTAWQSTSGLEIISVGFGLAYVILAAKENIWCWPTAFIGTGTAVFLFWDASLFMESALNVYYLNMAVIGWWQWKYGHHANAKLSIHTWGKVKHLVTLGLITILTLISGFLLSNNTSAALPYVDSFTTWSAVITTWMVARKILENWLYWILIDIVSVWLYLERGLILYAVLFVFYSVIAVFGYRQWRINYQQNDPLA